MTSISGLNVFPLYKVGQKVVIFNAAGEVLFLKRSQTSTRPGGWDFPGGRLEIEEALVGLQRETLEEANVQIQDVSPLSVHTLHLDDDDKRTIVIGYSAKYHSGTVQLSDEHDEFRWVAQETARTIELPPGHAELLNAALLTYKE